MTKDNEDDIRQVVIGYCLVCGGDDLLVLNGWVTCLGCKQKYTVEYFFGEKS